MKPAILLCLLGLVCHPVKAQIHLDNWMFYKASDSLSVSEVTLPHTWNIEDAFDDVPGYFRGQGVYETTINIHELAAHRYLHFKGANQLTRVYINDSLAGQHRGGYTAFDIPISEFLREGKNQIKVLVDNSHMESIPPLDADFTFYGGLYRKVYLMEENEISFNRNYGADDILLKASPGNEQGGILNLDMRIRSQEDTEVILIRKITDQEGLRVDSDSLKLPVKAGITAKNLSLKLPEVHVWSPSDPYLYNVELKLLDKNGTFMDRFEHKVGFRTVAATTEGFIINQDTLKLIGVNRHQDLEGFGNAVPVEEQLKDLMMIKEMGGNFLRLAHYPQHQEIYEMADSLGLVLWSEIPVVNKVPTGAEYRPYAETVLQMQKEHIAQSINHPSLVFIGYMNEIYLRMVFDKHSPEQETEIKNKTLELARELENLTRTMAPDHLTAMAIHGHQVYNETGISSLPMVLGWNLYYGWYVGAIEDLGPFLDEEFAKYPDRPLILSEYGVGSDSRLHTEYPEKYDFTEEYQLKYHQGYVEQVKERPYVIGMAAWNFSDFGSEFRGDTKPHINQKGLVSYDRSPKNTYWWYKAILREEKPLVHIWKDLPIHVGSTPDRSIKVITNRPVRLDLNGENIGVFEPHNGMIQTQVTLQPGSNKIKAYINKIVDSVQLYWQTPGLNKKGGKLELNFGASTYFTDRERSVWIPINKENEFFKVNEDVRNFRTSSNIRGTDEDPLYQTAMGHLSHLMIPLENGTYKVDLYLASFQKNKSIAYELGKEETGSVLKATHASQVRINNAVLDLGNTPPLQARRLTTEVEVSDGNIVISTDKGEYFGLNALRISRVK
ncbi:glycoside hydrolase family 2 protein [Zeaxanthinibacter enoshimensis]|nr:glycoside hydrolase family 2 TIM barrel-domain containing protein [Zeaxanthinibacter enoshimensis]